MQTITTEWLQSIETLKDVPADQLQWWIDNSTHYELDEGALIFKLDEQINATYLIVKGRVKIFVKQKMGERIIRYFEVKDVTGYLPFSRASASVVRGDNRTGADHVFPIEKMKQLIVNNYELTEAFVHIMISRVRDFTTIQQQNKKMMALGKLSAGLAHELNNPASAIVRDSLSLIKHLQLAPKLLRK